MENEKITVEMFILPDGKIPFEKWIKGLRDRTARAKIEIRIARIRLGNFGDYRSVGEGVYELRIDYGPGYRVYYGRSGNRVVLLLCGGDKSSQKEDVKKAKEYFSNYRLGFSDKDNDEEGHKEI